MKKLNKKGFTLVELLAVIVVLAVIMLLAVNAVIPQMEKARKNAFVTEAESVINAASAYYQAVNLGSETDSSISSSGGCISVEKLKGGYLEKNDTNFTGSVKITIDATTSVATYTIWLSNGQYKISGKSGEGISAANVEASTSAASTSCS